MDVRDALLALDARPALFVLLTAAILLGIYGERWRARMSRRDWQARRARRKTKPADRAASAGHAAAVAPFDSTAQLRHVMRARFSKRRLLNPSEARVWREAERAIAEAGQSWRAMAQVSLGEILASPDAEANRAINSKRVDILIVADDGDPLAAVEYQGKGHHQSSAAARDAIKKEALRRAGIGYIEVNVGDRPDDLRRSIAKLAQPR